MARYALFQQRWMSGAARFAAYLSFYPAVCHIRFLNEEQDERPLRIFLGSEDDYNSVAQCQEYVERIHKPGSDVALLVYPGARHAFDAPDASPLQYLPQNVNSRGCRYVERPDGTFAALHADTGRPVTPDAPVYLPGDHPRLRASRSPTGRPGRDGLPRDRFRFQGQTLKCFHPSSPSPVKG